ncbi:mitogen-activated protein kinase kinase kinase 4 isoform X4 [Octopus bimaculoides]|uniref:mitogen-activated protein kinase kinase kinase 4 isoform X4 n=1 Tax=Octopus bimaculoides TaxID=37653 RepID=UPI0022E1EAF2|nr:mitogen-activated protein kinase kinase kinase 4 isoform X4 [Octopus bimaculoides]
MDTERYSELNQHADNSEAKMSSIELENQCFATSVEIESLESSRKKSRLGKHRGKKKRNINTRLPVKITREQSSSAYSSPNDSDDLTDTDISSDSYKRDGLMSNQLGRLIYNSSNEESHLKNRFLFPNPQNYSKNQGLKIFHQHFSLLVGLGNQTSNYSKPQENIQLKNNNDSLWLSIQAWYNIVSLYEQEEILKQNRGKIPDILNEIINFKLNGCNNDDSAVLSESNINDISCDSSDFQNAYLSSNYVFTLTEETMNSQRFALKKVSELLDKLDFCERQFPTTKALGEVYPLYNQKHFIYRVKSLCLWLNITQELSHKIRLLGCVLQQNVQKRKDWPWFENYREIDNLLLGRYESAWSQLPNSETDSYFNQRDEKSCEDYAFNSFSQLSLICDSGKSTFSQPEFKFDLNDSDQSSLITSPATKLSASRSSKISRSSSYQSYSHICYEIDTGGESGSKSSFYHDYVDHGLKKMGMHKLLKRLRDLLSGSLSRAEEALCKPQENTTGFSSLSSNLSKDVSTLLPVISMPQMSESNTVDETNCCGSRKVNQGSWNKQFLELGLPSFRSSYLFLLRVLLDVVYECMRLRLDQRPMGEPSALSVRQLIRECKDVLKGAVQMKKYYLSMVSTTVWDSDPSKVEDVMDLEKYDAHMKMVLEVYFNYLQNWMNNLQNLPDASQSLKNTLEEEWAFTKSICPFVIGGEAEAGKRFSALASGLLSSIADFLENGVDEFYTKGNESEEETACKENGHNREGERDMKEVKTTSSHAINNAKLETNPDDTALDKSADDEAYHKDKVLKLRHRIQQTFRDSKNLFREGRERTSKALGFAKMLRNDLELAASYKMNVSKIEIISKLEEMKHVLVSVPLSLSYLIFIPERILKNQNLILQLLNVTCGKEDCYSHTDPTHDQDINRGYLLMLQCDNDVNKQSWKGSTVHVDATAQTAIALSHIAVDSLMLVVTHSSVLNAIQEEFSKLMDTTVEVFQEQISCHQAISESLAELKATAMHLRQNISSTLLQLKEKLYFVEINKMDTKERNHLLGLYCVTIIKGYNFGFEYHRELQRLVSDEQKIELGKCMISFAREWMNFISEKWEKGRGRRPTWANQGLEFLVSVCDPKIMELLPESEFSVFISDIKNCLDHIVGRSNTVRSPTSGSATSPDVYGYTRFPSVEETRPLGEGTFGKVYTAVNVDTGELMAMKEMKLKPTNKMRNPLKELVEEMNNLEGINHPNLVKYYGAEVQKDEMIIFMEYCDRGTIKEASKLGLPESIIRLYTREILKALCHLHENGIIHRDLKGANVFLTSDGAVKLGDFGCSVKLKSHSTIPGEISDLVGTTAYMAPEVFTRNDSEGHGRAADIWSLGCVVYEMSTGKQPWYDQHPYQIMFLVGLGNVPPIPENLSREGKEFLKHCFEIEPSRRPCAIDLLNHPFPKVSDEDMNL